ncbi:MBL fold metallo-hydrolase [Candidatus Bathyarchaeota archaeon]|nr:MBL fold metallo-hydrolase [Candidatus Bathyarchaeota archaeon]MBS7630559.1 MBL fold metallo-hydrolase [Candidatus Bathyarchaeota archaeon]
MSDLKLKWLGHASWKITTDDKVIYVDPYQGEYDEEADIILASHSHQDHFDPKKVKLIRGEKTVVIAPSDVASKVNYPVKSLKPNEEATFGKVTIKAVEAYNYKRFRSPGNPFHPKGFGVGYLIKTEGKVVYHAGDTDFIPEMKDLKGLDLVLVPSGGTYTMDNAEAAQAVIAMHPKITIPMHIWDTNPGEFKRMVESESDIKVSVLRPGETFEL